MDRAITASEANQHFSRMLRDVEGGLSYVVTSRGRPVARIVPVGASDQVKAVDALIDFLETLPDRDAGAWRREDLYR